MTPDRDPPTIEGGPLPGGATTMGAEPGEQAETRSEDPGLPPRYAFLGLIKAGGMGEVLRVRDTALSRVVALKRTLRADPEASAAFRREARLLANLDHPSIVPVYDHGELADGRLWFTMREVRGEELESVVMRVHAASTPGRWGATPDGWTLHRLIAALESVCQAVAFAHEKGVIHRDLKPANVLIGAFGEVQVIDFGIAWISGRRTGAAMGVAGTVGYMSPEQASGEAERITPAADVWAIGAMLYQVLASVAPPMTAAWRPDACPPRLVARTSLPAPESLVRLYERCMAWRPEDRLPLAEVSAGLRAWIDGTERSARARRMLAEALEIGQAARRLGERAEGLREEAAEALRTVLPHDDVARKREGWSILDAAAEAERNAAELTTRSVIQMQLAVALDPQLDAARGELAQHYIERIEAASRAGDTVASASAEEALQQYAPTWWTRWSDQRCHLSLRTEPAGARVELFRLQEQDRRLVPVSVGPLGTTPLVGVDVPPGRLLVEVSAPGRRTVRVPITLERGQREEGLGPDGAPVVLRLPLEAELGPDDVFIPGGWCVVGGDPAAVDPFPLRRLWVDAFVMRRFPVTIAEYTAFLNHQLAQGDAPELLLPLGLAQGTNGSGELAIRRGVVEPGDGIGAGPIREVSWHAARAYARWQAQCSGLPWRLAWEVEWEKAARGVDGRLWPWGNHFDPTWANTVQSRAKAPGVCAVTAFPEDESVYGVRGLGGNIRDWCADGYRSGWAPPRDARWVPEETIEGHRVVRGGAFASSAPYARSASRFASPAEARLSMVGFRLVRGVGEERPG